MTNTAHKGGPAFPGDRLSGFPGMSLRDWFAANMDRDEYGDQSFRNLSLAAKEVLAGKAPSKAEANASGDDRVAWQLAQMKWELSVRAAIRFQYADAMLKAREET